MRIQSVKDLEKISKEASRRLYLPEGVRVNVGMASCGIAAGARATFDKALKDYPGGDSVEIRQTGCIGFCEEEPLVELLAKERPWMVYKRVTEGKVSEIVQDYMEGEFTKKWILGQMRDPRSVLEEDKYVHTVEKGFRDGPSNLNNVETYANVPVILLKGADWYAGMGTKYSKGTKVFSLVGKVKNTGLVEVPMGTTLREIIYDMGGGIPRKRKFKAVQTGGPSGGCIPEAFLDVGVDFDELTKLGSIMGSGGMIVMDQDTCMVDLVRYFMDFLKEESCGQCNPCREGIKRMLEILSDICQGQGKEGDIELLEELASMIQKFSLCGLGTSAPNPVLTTILYFRDEYEAHIRDKKCPAGVCKPLFHYEIDEEACTGCHVCALKCPQEAITGDKKKVHRLDGEKCIKCGICYEACKFDAIVVR